MNDAETRLPEPRPWWLLAVLVPALALATSFWFVCDDAFITWRYSKNWVEGHGIRYNLGDHVPVEGYSNFLWMALSAGYEALGMDVTLFVPATSLVLGGLWLVVIGRAAQVHLQCPPAVAALVTALVGLSMPFAVWCTSGLATMPYALLITLLFERTVLAREAPAWQIGSVALATALIRTEGLGWVGVIAVLAVAVAVADGAEGRARLRRLAGGLLAAGALYAAYFGWRATYYDSWLANTAYAKVGFGWPKIARGLSYVGHYHVVFWMPALAWVGLPTTVKHLGWRGAAIAVMALAFPTYGAVVGGDYMVAGRILVPGLSFSVWMLGPAITAGIRRWPIPTWAGALALLGSGLLPSFGQQPLWTESIREVVHFRLNTNIKRTELKQWTYMQENGVEWALQGQAIAAVAPPGASLVQATIGAVGYYSGITIYDRGGLVDREVARRPMPPGPLTHSPGHDKMVSPLYFLDRNPTYLRAMRVAHRRYRAALNLYVQKWRRYPPRVRQLYAPNFYEVPPSEADVPTFLLTLERVDGDADEANRLWLSFTDRLRSYELQYVP